MFIENQVKKYVQKITRGRLEVATHNELAKSGTENKLNGLPNYEFNV